MSGFPVTLFDETNTASQVLYASSVMDQSTVIGLICSGQHANMFLHLSDTVDDFHPLDVNAADVDFVAFTPSESISKLRHGTAYTLAWNNPKSTFNPWPGRHAICSDYKLVALSFVKNVTKPRSSRPSRPSKPSKSDDILDDVPLVTIE